MKNGTVLLIGLGAVGVTAGAVFLMRRGSVTGRSPAPGTIPDGSTRPGKGDVWGGLFNSLTTLGVTAIKTFGNGSAKPTTPAEVGDFNQATRPAFLMA
jgi:hypothetical protein